jgi:hypothetical protein
MSKKGEIYMAKQKKGGCGTWIWALLIIGFFAWLLQGCPSGDDTKKSDKEETKTEETKEEDKEVSLYDGISKEINSDIAQQLVDILQNDLGFSDLVYEDKDENLNLYNFTANDYTLSVTADSEGIYKIFIPDSTYTFYEDGNVVLTREQMENTMITSNQWDVYWIMAKDIIEQTLKNPNSADFPSSLTSSDIYMQRNGNTVAVKSYVDATNSFGATVRTNFVVEFEVIDEATFSYNTIYIETDGTVLYGSWVDLN